MTPVKICLPMGYQWTAQTVILHSWYNLHADIVVGIGHLKHNLFIMPVNNDYTIVDTVHYGELV